MPKRLPQLILTNADYIRHNDGICLIAKVVQSRTTADKAIITKRFIEHYRLQGIDVKSCIIVLNADDACNLLNHNGGLFSYDSNGVAVWNGEKAFFLVWDALVSIGLNPYSVIIPRAESSRELGAHEWEQAVSDVLAGRWVGAKHRGATISVNGQKYKDIQADVIVQDRDALGHWLEGQRFEVKSRGGRLSNKW